LLIILEIFFVEQNKVMEKQELNSKTQEIKTTYLVEAIVVINKKDRRLNCSLFIN